jgi:MFS family permease
MLWNKNVLLLLLAQLIFVSGSAMTVTMGGIVGSQIAPSQSLATLPVSLTILGTALGTVPATVLMGKMGRRLGFTFAAILAVIASLIAGAAISMELFALYCFGTALTGFTLAFSQQFRFAAAEAVPLDKAGQAISLILLGSIGGAVVGPQLVASGHWWQADKPFVGSVIGAAMLFMIAALLLSFISNVRDHHTRPQEREPFAIAAVFALFREPLFGLAVVAGVVGQGIMTFIMTATPVSMHVMDGHSLPDTAAVIRAHVLAMYAPSLVSGLLISRFGERRLMLAGVTAYIATLGFGLAGHDIMHYSVSMILLGIGWNFLFVGGTTLLVKTYPSSQRFTAQGVNEALVFGTSAVGSLLAGTLLMTFGWEPLLYSTLPMMLLMALMILRLWRKPLPLRGTD